MKLTRPLLPAELVKRIQSDDMMSGFESEVFSQSFHENRLSMRNWSTPHSPDSFCQDTQIGFFPELKRTLSHMAAYDGDVLALYEMLGLGATADQPDTSGITPICLAVRQLAMTTSPHAIGMRPDGGMMTAVDFRREASRFKCVIRILVEQHVVLDRTIEPEGEPLINLLCRAKAWDTIELFLKHGAKPPSNPVALFPTASDRSKFTSLLKSCLQPGVGRPARICPCWSGKIVEECHAKATHPYPLAYVCVCGSGRTYKSCCLPKNWPVLEKWDPKLKRIMHDYDRFAMVPGMKKIQQGFQEARKIAQALGIEYPEKTAANPKEIKDKLKGTSKELLGKGLIDPAFAYALSRADFSPQPRGRNISRPIAENYQKRNMLIDEYIATQKDLRPRQSIERAAKIGPWNGALIRACEGPGCGNIEGTDVQRLKLCSKCQLSVYCGSDCQRRAWKMHKTQCSKPGQKEQSLPSQDVVSTYIERTHQETSAAFMTLLTNGPPL
ncbi:hypothetical protein FB451DRAFT_656850 [Mycena latifolia]|nr:hypothetical protein FB451DRAFT_656850 [Mycena latifolia]